MTGRAIEGVRLFDARSFEDDRGRFAEVWNEERYATLGLRFQSLQENVSVSRKGVLRGLHAQNPRPQAKLVTCVWGEIWDVVVDARLDSATFGRWSATILSPENRRQVFMPCGTLHGFVVLSREAVVVYKCGDVYDAAAELNVAWDDPDIGVAWPVTDPILSPKDACASRLHDIPRERLRWSGG